MEVCIIIDVIKWTVKKFILPVNIPKALETKLVRSANILRENYKPKRKTIEFPWRKPRTQYRIFLAEFLLVRTKAEAVARVFPLIIEKYPNIKKLSEAKEKELNELLKSLGLPQRVPLLIRAALYIRENHSGRIPKTTKELIKVPGLGRYSAAAITAFIFNSSEVPGDVNILRFVARLTGLPMEHKTKGSKEIWLLLPFLSKDRGGPKPEKLLDFTRTVCSTHKPKCEVCPVSKNCVYFSSLDGVS